MKDDRVLEAGAGPTEKQKEAKARHERLRARKASRWRKVLPLAAGLLLLQPEAYHRTVNILGRLRRSLWNRLRSRIRTTVELPDNAALFQRWRAANEPDAAQLAAQRRLVEAWPSRPLISVVTPVFSPPAAALADSIASVRDQTYDRWELVLVLAGPQPPDVTEAVRAASADSRIRSIALDTNGGIASNTSAGIAEARGDFVAFLDHDDLLSPEALFEVAWEIRADPTADIITFDEDKASADGTTRLDPIFKPSMTSPEHMLSFNDRMHSVVRKRCLDELGEAPTGVDGAQDWDMALRLLDRGARARHIPRVLYHWRMVPGSAAADALAKPWAYDAQRVVLQAALERRGLHEVVVDHPQIGVPRARWRASGCRVSIIIPTKDRATLLETCLRSLRERTAYANYEVIVVDTGSREPETARLYERLAGDRAIAILHDDAPFNFSGVNNRAARTAGGDVLVFLNNDIEVTDAGWLEEVVRWAERPEVGCVGPKLLYPDGTLQHAGIVMGLGGHGSHVYQRGPARHDWGVFGSVDFYRNYLAMGGACLGIRRPLFESLGGFDESYTLCYSDIDLCLRAANAGHRNVYTPFAELRHHEGGTRGLQFPPADVLRASVLMYPLVVHGDPFFSRNLSFQRLMPTIAVEDRPDTRAELIERIATDFEVKEELDAALFGEMLGKTSAWRVYERLISSMLPAPPPDARRAGGLKLLVVSHDLSRSGAPMVLLHLVKALRRLGHELTVLSPKAGPLREDMEEAGARVIVSPFAVEAPYVLADLLGAFDAVLPNTILAWRVVLAAAARRKPVIWLIHEAEFGLDILSRRHGVVEALAMADEVVFPSRATRSLYREFDAGNMSSEFYGIDVPEVGDARSLGAGSFHLVSLGSLEPRKGQDILVKAFRTLPREVREKATLHLVGRVLDKPFTDVLRGVARSLPVTLHGEVPPKEAHAYLAAADAFVFASRDDPSPTVILEAMALGKPIITTTVGSVPDLLEDGRSALLVRPEDAGGLSRAIERLVREPALAQRLGEEARRVFAERLSNERYGRAIEARLARAIDKKHAT